MNNKNSVLENRQMAAELIYKAIVDLNEPKGSTLHNIKNYINKEYKLPPQVIKKLIVPTLENGVIFGAIRKDMGQYQLGNLMDDIVQLGCSGSVDKRRDRPERSSSCRRPKRRCQRSSKNFRRIDYKSADACYEDSDNQTGETPRACNPSCPREC